MKMRCILSFIKRLFVKETTKVPIDIDLNLANETNWELAKEILDLINDYRASVGLNRIKIDKGYASALAVLHTKYMISINKINHDNFGERSEALKYIGIARVGENVAYGYDNAEDLVYSWLKSPTHKRVIEGNFTHSGFGIVQGDSNKFFYTQLFYQHNNTNIHNK